MRSGTSSLPHCGATDVEKRRSSIPLQELSQPEDRGPIPNTADASHGAASRNRTDDDELEMRDTAEAAAYCLLEFHWGYPDNSPAR